FGTGGGAGNAGSKQPSNFAHGGLGEGGNGVDGGFGGLGEGGGMFNAATGTVAFTAPNSQTAVTSSFTGNVALGGNGGKAGTGGNAFGGLGGYALADGT